MNAIDLIADIPEQIARSAYYNTSHSPERRGQQEREGYAQQLLADYNALAKLIADKPEMAPILETEFARYRHGYRERLIKKLHSDSRCASWFITGPANFPVARMEKRNRVAHKRLEELLDFRKRAMDAIRKTLCPELRPIMAGDSDAPQRLREKIAEAEKEQEHMKTVNAVLRKYLKRNDTAGKAALVEMGIHPAEAERIFTTKDCFGGYGYASFELTNNSANIRRMKQRLEGIERNQSTPTSERNGVNARIEDCPSENRIRLFFPGKPDASIRSRLKSNGFRWTPTLGCWQAYRNSNSLHVANKEAGL